MKRKSLTRLKRLSAALTAVMLMNAFLFLLENLKANSTPDIQTTITPAADNTFISPENINGSPSGSVSNESQSVIEEEDDTASDPEPSQAYAGEAIVSSTAPAADSLQSPSESSSDTITLCLMGDLMCLAGQQYTAEQSDGTHDYTGSFYLMRDTLTACDFVIGNLETILSESSPYSTKEREVNEQPNCNAPADYLASLTWAGITHIVTANNHSLDPGFSD